MIINYYYDCFIAFTSKQMMIKRTFLRISKEKQNEKLKIIITYDADTLFEGSNYEKIRNETF